MERENYWSRLPGFFSLHPTERRDRLALLKELKPGDFSLIDEGLSLEQADLLSENVVGSFALPFSLAANFIIDDQPVLIPMVTEEPSIVAATSKMAKLAAWTGGFVTEIAPALMKGQIQFYNVKDSDKVRDQFYRHKTDLLAYANSLCPRMVSRGAGVIDMDIRIINSRIGTMAIIEPIVDVKDAMGANMVNTLMESLSSKLVEIIDGSLGLRILSNLCDQRLAHGRCAIPFSALADDHSLDNGREMAEKMLAAHAFAEADPYRACTHNKGILNGIVAVGLASGNDTRALEAGAHAYAAKNGYGPLTKLDIDYKKGMLVAELRLPLAVGVVGGLTKSHGGVRFSHRILGPFAQSSKKLASVMVSVGLSQCLAAMFALCKEGIQQGHMKLHHRKHNLKNP